MTVKKCYQASLLAASIALLTACGTQTAENPATTASADESTAHEVAAQDVITAFTSMNSPDFAIQPWRSITGKSTVVALTEVVQVGLSRTTGEVKDDPFAARRSAVQVRLLRVTKRAGAPSIRPGDNLWVELKVDPDVLGSGLVPGQRIGLFLKSNVDPVEYFVADTANSIVPPDARLWQVADPQGIVVEPEVGGGLVVPYGDGVDATRPIERFFDSIEDLG